jgi:hypothetical protein
MRRVMFVLAVAAVVMVAAPAQADKLGYSAGGGIEGLLQEVTFLVGGLPSIYPRSEIASVTVAEDGKDALKLQDGRTVTGKLVTVRFRTSESLTAMTRKEVKSIEVVGGYELSESKKKRGVSDSPSTAAKPSVAMNAAQQQALAVNKKLFKEYAQKADEMRKKDIEAFARKYKSKWEQAVRDVQRLEKSVDQKQWNRRQASRKYQPDSRYRSDYDRLLTTDDLLRTQRELSKARRDRDKLKKTLKDGRKEIDKRSEQREKRLKAVAAENARDIKGGASLTEDQMRRRYEPVVAAKGGGKKSEGKKKGG